MGEIVVKNCTYVPSTRPTMRFDIDGNGLQMICYADISATYTFTMDEAGTAGSLLKGMSESEIRADNIFTAATELYAYEIGFAINERTREVVPSKETFAGETAIWAKLAEERANNRNAAQYQARISDIRFDSIRLSTADGNVLYEWKPTAVAAAAGGQWTCGYCGTVGNGNFCGGCGAPRH